jgi:DNA-3-methyladenine glycosylase
MMALGSDFFARDVALVARDLVGTELYVDAVGGAIVETEAYAPTDPASHSFGGPTLRNMAMFGPPGCAYVYRIYGRHWCLNLTTGAGSAVLIRALLPMKGLALMKERRRTGEERKLCSGPGKLCTALGVDRRLDGLPLNRPPFKLLAAHGDIAVVTGARIGITRASHTPWRFGLRGSSFLSRPFETT